MILSQERKISILQSVSLFSGTPDEILANVADLLEEVDIDEGQNVFEKGDIGNCMYIITNGSVRVHDGDLVFNDLWTGSVFGEIALLDTQPRLATVTALTKTNLLRLNQAPFYDLMSARAEVGFAVIRVLSRYLRARLRDMAKDYDYIQQMNCVANAAVELERGHFQKETLKDVTIRNDELGQLARTFQKMATEVVARETNLRQQAELLRIDLDAIKKQQDVAAIVETDYFQALQAKARTIRQNRSNETS